MKIRVILIAIWLISSSITHRANFRPVFGVRVSVGDNSRITTFACYTHNGRNLVNKKVVTNKETFVKIVSGYWPSPYNPKRENLFKQNGIDCDIFVDSITNKPYHECIPLDSLWKIRFAVYPYRGKTEKGWSRKFHRPSHHQERYLADRYGVNQIDGEFFLDTSFWMLLTDVMDNEWIENYKAME